MKRTAAVLSLTLAMLAGCDGTDTAAPSDASPSPVGSVATTPAPGPEATPSAEATPTPEPSTSPDSMAVKNMAAWTLTTAGWGPVRTGAPVPSDLRGQIEPRWECIGPKILDAPGGTPQMEVFAGAEGGEPVTALHIVNPAIATASGIRVGDSLSELQQTYPGLEPFPNQQVEAYVISSEAYSMFFEMDENSPTVRHISVQPSDAFYAFSFQVCGAP